ncbi:hypothetical protein [Oceanithermus sp.]|uniref:hypothetical protein n=1 Tax=Oceanithermus sp. TaxID=2268145 RepID=UPI00257D1DB5|nr:hypothetical protein [Oceanithermus sp.]
MHTARWWVVVAMLGLGAVPALAHAAPGPRFSVAAVLVADLGVELPRLDARGRLLDDVHLGFNPAMAHLGYRRYFEPLPRGGRTVAFWGAGVLVPWQRPGLALRYNYLALGIQRFFTARIYAGAQVNFSPGMLYHVLYEPPDVSGSMDASPFLILVPSFYLGFLFD